MSRRRESGDAVADEIDDDDNNNHAQADADPTDADADELQSAQNSADDAPRTAKKAKTRSAKSKVPRSENAAKEADDDADDDVSAWRIDRLRLVDFKSYGGEQLIGPFMDFQAIIGPNGAGARRKNRFFVGFFSSFFLFFFGAIFNFSCQFSTFLSEFEQASRI
jgi:hypothetical protein